MCDHASTGCFFTRKEGREADLATSPRRQAAGGQAALQSVNAPRDPPAMVVQGDFRKVSGISSEIFRQIETVENEHDAATAAALQAVERRGEMVVRILEPRSLTRSAAEASRRFLALQDAKHNVYLVEIVKRPGQTLGLYIREGNGLERCDGVFISRIALESAVYHSGCLKVGDEILAVNLVDVTRMSLDDVVIIMSIPRRLVLVTRQRKPGKGGNASPHLQPRTEHKPPPVVVMKKEVREDEDREELERLDAHRRRGDGREMMVSHSRSRLGLGLTGLGSHQDLGILDGSSSGINGDATGLELFYNSRPEPQSHSHHSAHSHHSGSVMTPSHGQPPPPPPHHHHHSMTTSHSSTNWAHLYGSQVITEQPKSHQQRYPNTLESLAEKVHSFYSGPTTPQRGPQPTRRMSMGPMVRSDSHHAYYSTGTRPSSALARSGSDQHLPRIDSGVVSLRSSLKHHSGYTGRYRRHLAGQQGTSTLDRYGSSHRQRPSLDYASDTEATCGSSSYYYYRQPLQVTPKQPTITSSGASSVSLRSNSLPRDHSRTRLGGSQRTSLLQTQQLAQARHDVVARFGSRTPGLLDQQDDSDGAVSAPELPVSGRTHRGRIPSSPSVFTSDEYRAWLSRTPSSSAIYERIRASRDFVHGKTPASSLGVGGRPRFTYSAENLTRLDQTPEDQSYYSSSTYRPQVTRTLDRHGTSSSRRVRQLLELEASRTAAAHSAAAAAAAAAAATSANRSSVTSTHLSSRLHHLDINPAEFLKYKMDKPAVPGVDPAVSGLLWVHLLAGRGLRTASSSLASTPSGCAPSNIGTGLRDLYCVLECDRVHKARTVVRSGDLLFDWDETFELDLVDNIQLDLLIYSWDTQYRHKLCYKGSVHLSSLLRDSPIHQLALKVEPRGTLFLRLKHTDPLQTFSRRGPRQHLFGQDLDTVVQRDSLCAAPVTPGAAALACVPVIIRRCVHEVETRGLDIIGLYRLCGSANKKRILREAFERNARTVDLSPDNVPDINVITGVLKDYLRELPEPLFTKCLYQMMVDALSVCLPDDPEGNAKLMFSILDCLPKVNRSTLIFLLDHLALVVSQCERNKMSPQNLAIVFGPVLMLQSEEGRDLDFAQPISVLKYLLEIWPVKSVREGLAAKTSAPLTAAATPSSLPVSACVTAPVAAVVAAQVPVSATSVTVSRPWAGIGAAGPNHRPLPPLPASQSSALSPAQPVPPPHHQVVVVSSPDSTSEDSSSGSGRQPSLSSLRLKGEDQQPLIQTPTSSTTTEDSRKELGGREADVEPSDEEKEEENRTTEEDEE